MSHPLLSCYACSRPATSREHAPPKCLFPEAKDIPGFELRRDLITVPSCDLHNTAKSHDDEFLMVSIAGIIGNNSIGYQHNAGKVGRAVRRSAHRLLEKIFLKEPKNLRLEIAPNRFIDVLWGTPDASRLQNCFEAVVRGLLHHDFGKTFRGEVRIHLGFLHFEPGNAQTFSEFLRKRVEMDVSGKPKMGANPSVFYYQRTDLDAWGLFAYRLCFYERVEVFAAIIPEGKLAPSHLMGPLISGGVRTVITLGPEKFEFN